MIKNRLILTGIFIEMGVIEIEYELNKINVFTKIDEEPMATGLSKVSLLFFFLSFVRLEKMHICHQKRWLILNYILFLSLCHFEFL